jgi:hypothetical protein
MGNDDASMTSSSPEAPIGGPGANGASSSSLQDMGEIKVLTDPNFFESIQRTSFHFIAMQSIKLNQLN